MLIIELQLYLLFLTCIFHTSFTFKMTSKGSPWQRHCDRRTSKDNAERRASLSLFILQRQLNLHFDQGQYHVCSCNNR